MMHQQVAAVSQSAEDTAGAVAGQIAGAAAANAHQLLHKQLGEKERRVAELEVKLAAAEAELEAAVRPTAARATAVTEQKDALAHVVEGLQLGASRGPCSAQSCCPRKCIIPSSHAAAS